MRLLILGGTGMLGHTLHHHLSENHDVVSTTRRALADLSVDPTPFFIRGEVREHTDAANADVLRQLLIEERPDVVLNAIGVIKQRDEGHDPTTAISINALFPHVAARACMSAGVRFLHVSTDCVFSGDRGDYREDDDSDARDLYGRTKYLGEVVTGGTLTLRTSIIGRELDNFESLVEWFLRQHDAVRGFTRAIYTGLSTVELARIVDVVLTAHQDLEGLYHVASTKISKYDLLGLIRNRFDLQERITLVPDDTFRCDRSLVGDRFVAATGIRVASWGSMVDDLAEDANMYGSVRDDG